MEETSFEVLEQKVRNAAELVKRLRKENKAFEEELARSRTRLGEAERRLAELEGKGKSSEVDVKELDSLRGELRELRTERREVRNRIAKLVELLDGLDG